LHHGNAVLHYKKARSMAGFFYCVVQNDIGLRCAGTLLAAGKAFDTGLLKNEDGQNRTLYSLRNTYATYELLRGGTDIHTLSKQMGNSAAMIERHYSKLTATMAADRLA
jgi:integrase